MIFCKQPYGTERNVRLYSLPYGWFSLSLREHVCMQINNNVSELTVLDYVCVNDNWEGYGLERFLGCAPFCSFFSC